MNFNYSINAHGSSGNTFYYDYIGNTTNDVQGGISLYWNSGGNNITHCTISGTPYAIGIELSSGNSVTENNLLGGILVQLTGKETIDRNYWSNYSTRHPDATEIDSSGIGNTPYVFDAYREVTGTLQDNHPLMKPVSIPNFGTSPSSPSTAVPEFPSLLVVLTLFMALSVPFTLSILVRRRKIQN